MYSMFPIYSRSSNHLQSGLVQYQDTYSEILYINSCRDLSVEFQSILLMLDTLETSLREMLPAIAEEAPELI